jgi:PhnB protein
MLQPFITFQGQAKEAMDFYEQVFGGTGKEVMLYGEMPSNPEAPPMDEKMKDMVLYGKLTVRETNMMFSDTNPDFHAPETFARSSMVSLAADFESEDALRTVYEKLKDGGFVMMELGEQFFAKMYAWVADKYGVTWQLTYNPVQA